MASRSRSEPSLMSAQTTGPSRLEQSFTRLADNGLRSCYGSTMDDIRKGRPSPPAPGRGPDRHDKPDPVTDWREKQKEIAIRSFQTTHRRMFEGHPDHRPPPSTKKKDAEHRLLPQQLKVSEERVANFNAKMREFEKQQDAVSQGYNPPVEIVLTAPCDPPKSTMHSNYVGGLPPLYWKSDFKANFGVVVHASHINAKYQQPTQLVALAAQRHKTLSV
mmetsp:Transcript_52730/g.112820  ORF Transcript_52730/g.112820 Transcript_52730/m.112820 type:complete len:218 (-) Transcript_52730:107-760(-)